MGVVLMVSSQDGVDSDPSSGQAEPAAAQQPVGGHGGHGEAEQHYVPRGDQEQAPLPQVKGGSNL